MGQSMYLHRHGVGSKVKFALLAALMAACVVGLGMLVTTGASEAYAAERVSIFVDGANGNDSNDGKSAATAVQSWDKAKELLGCDEGDIFIVGTVQASGVISTKEPGKQSVKRTSDIPMFEVSGEATFANIDVDGEDSAFNSPAVKPASGAKLNFLSGAKFHNIGYVEPASANETNSPEGYPMGIPDNTTGGCVVLLQENTTILVDGAEFTNNSGKGVFFAPVVGFNGGPGNVTLTMKSGKATGNKGYFYHNEFNGKSNKIYIYNALIRNNDATNMGSRYSSYVNRIGAVYVCDMGQIELRSEAGAAIFGNIAHDLIYIDGQPISGEQNIEFLNDGKMLGGGSANWEHSTVDDSREVPEYGLVERHYDVYDAHPSDADMTAAANVATSIIESNQSTVIDSNGAVYFGRGNETVPETPVVPADQGCDTPASTKVSTTVEKKWADADGNAIDWPEGATVAFTVKYGANDAETITVSEAGAVKTKEYDEVPGAEWSVAEVSETEGYTKGDVEGNATDGFTVTNTKTTEPSPEPSPEPGPNPEPSPEPGPDPTPEPTTLTMKISKTDLGGTEISGAQMKLEGPEGFETVTWTSNGTPKELTLKPGDYTLTEVVAPQGYKQVTTAITFTVTDEGKVANMTTEVNNGGIIEFQDSVNHLTLKDAPETTPTPTPTTVTVKIKSDKDNKVIIVDEDGKTVDSWTSDGNEKNVPLKPGTYKVTATDKSNNSKTDTIVIDEDGTVKVNGTTVDADKPITVNPAKKQTTKTTTAPKAAAKASTTAKTSDDMAVPMTSLGALAVLALGVGVYSLRRRMQD